MVLYDGRKYKNNKQQMMMIIMGSYWGVREVVVLFCFWSGWDQKVSAKNLLENVRRGLISVKQGNITDKTLMFVFGMHDVAEAHSKIKVNVVYIHL